MTKNRYALIPRAALRGDEDRDLEQVRAYLPSCYEATLVDEDVIIVHGADVAGWTLDEFVIPRLASGLIPCREVNLYPDS